MSLNGQGLGTVTEEMVEKRARELAQIKGRPENVLDTDLEEARQELTSAAEDVPRSERIPEEDRWNVIPEGKQDQAPTVPAQDEQTFAEELVQEGVEDAELERMKEAAEENAQEDKEQET